MLASLVMSDDIDAGGPAPLLLFVHIPKTAGTTLSTVLRMNAPRPRSRGLTNVFKGSGGVSTTLIERLRDGHVRDLTRVMLLQGHVPLGVRDYLQSYLPDGRELRCFTFLREPVDRTLSHYFSIRGLQRPYKLAPLGDDATLEDAVAAGYIHDNLQTRMLSGLSEPFGPVDDEMLERAKHNLREGLVFFGLTERFDESLVLARLRLGLRTILYGSSGRVNADRPRGDDVPAGLRRAAEQSNRYDTQLYRYAEELFSDAPERGLLDFEVELGALRTAKADGAIDAQAQPPAPGVDRESVWRMLLDARAQLLRLEFERARRGIPTDPAMLEENELVTELRLARTRVGELERSLEETAARLEEARSRRHKLQRRVKRLRSDAPAAPPEGRGQKRGGDP
jgi:hypothetical protein